MRIKPVLHRKTQTSLFPYAAALLGFLFLPMNARAQQDTERTKFGETIHVSGVGEVQAAPDSATVRLGVVTEAESAGEALAANTKAVEKLFETLDRFSIEQKDRQTVQFSVSPQYRRDPPRRTPGEIANAGAEPRIVGYQVTNVVAITVGKLDQLGDLLDAVVQAGANRIQNVQFAIDQREELENQARRRAIENATAKAKVLAEAAGVSLGRVLSIREQGTSSPPGPRPNMMMAESRSVPIASGEQTVSAVFDVTFELRPE